MVDKKIKSTLIISVVLAIGACAGPLPGNNPEGRFKAVPAIENFNELENEYDFSSKALTESYLERKLLAWLGPPIKGAQLVKEIAFAIFKYPDLFRDLMVNNQNDLLNRINAVTEVQTRRNVDPAFAAFLDSCFPPEFQVNTYTSMYQLFPTVAMDADGDFVVTWSSYKQENNQWLVYAQRYNSAGTPRGTEFRVSILTENQIVSAVAMDADGDFVVTWMSGSRDGDNFGILARRFTSAGTPLAPEFLVNTYTSKRQVSPAVAMDSDGDFVIAWGSGFYKGSVYQDGSVYGVYAQRYNSAGAPEGSEFQVNTFTAGRQDNPAVAMDSNGDFVITWQSGYYSDTHWNGDPYTGVPQDGSLMGIYAQRYNSAGTVLGSEFHVSTLTTGRQDNPAVAMDSNGDFVITWQSGYNYGGVRNGSYSSVYAQRYDSTGFPAGSEFRVSSCTTENQMFPSVAMDTNGDFVITWQSGDYYTVNGQDGSYRGAYARRYSSTGSPTGPEFRLNTYTTLSQGNATVAMDSDGNFVAAWNSGGYTDGAQDGSYFGVFARRYNRNGVPL
jgi:hypothetical protein